MAATETSSSTFDTASLPTLGRHDRLILGSIGALSLIALIVLGALYWDDRDYWILGIPTYLTGLGTLGLGAVAYRTMQQEAADRRALQASAARDRERAERAEAKERERREYDARRAQANQVQIAKPISLGGVNNSIGYRVIVENRSQDAIHDIRVFSMIDPASASVEIQPPILKIDRIIAGNGESASFNTVSHGRQITDADLHVWVTYRDAHDRLWARDPAHRLTEVDVAFVRTLEEHAQSGRLYTGG